MNSAIDFFHQDTAGATGPAPTPANEAEACAAVLIACMRANELDSHAEDALFEATIRSRNIFKGHDPTALIEAASLYYEQAGSPARLIDAVIGAIREQTRLPLYYQCLDIILSDGIVTPMEHKVFQYLQGKFKVDDELAWKAMSVLTEKNKL